jgi:hypothetical protein
VITFYVHHRGAGHRLRAAAIARHLREPVAGLSTSPAPDDWPGDWVVLPDDAPRPDAAGDPTAGGALHWAPPHHPGLRERMARIAAWIAERRPRLLVADVSVEVTLLARAMGTPVVVMAMPGHRGDAPHQLAYRAADMILAAWPRSARCLATGMRSWRAKLHPVGAISRFDGRTRPGSNGRDGSRRVLVLAGRGGVDWTLPTLEAAAQATPGWTWSALGLPGGRWEADPWTALAQADVVVTPAGQNAVADVGAARRPAVVLPQQRPHGEQLATARALREDRLAVCRSRWPTPAAWPTVLAEAEHLGGAGWTRWVPGDGARRAAAALEEIATSA